MSNDLITLLALLLVSFFKHRHEFTIASESQGANFQEDVDTYEVVFARVIGFGSLWRKGSARTQYIIALAFKSYFCG